MKKKKRKNYRFCYPQAFPVRSMAIIIANCANPCILVCSNKTRRNYYESAKPIKPSSLECTAVFHWYNICALRASAYANNKLVLNYPSY